MEFKEFINLIARKKQTIFSVVFFTLALAIVISLLSPIKYGVNSRLLIIQDSSHSDAYVLSRSNEYVSNLLAEVVYSSSFYDQVLNSKYNINRTYFSNDYKKALKKWRQTVSAKVLKDTGIIELNIYHSQSAEAKKIALAVNDILINNNKDYQSNQNMVVKILDKPLVSSYPVKPNIIFNLALALILSIFISLVYIYIWPEEKYDFYIIKPKSKIKARPSNVRVKKMKRPSRDQLEYLREEESHNNIYDDYESNDEISGDIKNIISNDF